VRLLLLSDQETGVSRVDRNQVAVLVASRAEVLACASKDLIVLVTNECIECARESRRERSDDPALSVANVLFVQWHVPSPPVLPAESRKKVILGGKSSRDGTPVINFVPLPQLFPPDITFFRSQVGRTGVRETFSLAADHPTKDSTVEELIEAQRKLAVSANPMERIVGSLCMAARLKRSLAALPDAAVGQLMFDVVWNVIDVFSPEMAICQEATERLLEHQPGDQMMTRVWERAVFVGSLKDAEELVGANSMKIASVLSLCSEEIERKNPTIHYTRVPIADAQPISAQEFDEIMGAIDHGLRRGDLLIHCAAGYSRSPILAAAWMHRCGYINFEAALKQIARVRPTTDPSPVLLKSIKEALTR
jgi:protein-tyrosine phosphatase